MVSSKGRPGFTFRDVSTAGSDIIKSKLLNGSGSDTDDDFSSISPHLDDSDKWLSRNERNRRKKNRRIGNDIPVDQTQFKKRDKKSTPKSGKH